MNSCQVLFLCTALLLLIIVTSRTFVTDSGPSSSSLLFPPQAKNANQSMPAVVKPQAARLTLSQRKLLLRGSCTNRDISISQSRDTTTSGIPQFIVQIVNTCTSRCAPSNIHLHCAWFASARVVNPSAFKRLSYDDCLINGGKAMKRSQIIRFTYSNSFMYPLAFKSAKFC